MASALLPDDVWEGMAARVQECSKEARNPGFYIKSGFGMSAMISDLFNTLYCTKYICGPSPDSLSGFISLKFNVIWIYSYWDLLELWQVTATPRGLCAYVLYRLLFLPGGSPAFFLLLYYSESLVFQKSRCHRRTRIMRCYSHLLCS